MPDKFDTHAQPVLDALLAGVSLAAAATQCGVGERTISRWLAQGRDEPEGRFGEFARQVDQANAERDLPDNLDDLTEVEIRQLLSRMARKGSIPAIRLWLEHFTSAPTAVNDSPAEKLLAGLDELAERRRNAV